MKKWKIITLTSISTLVILLFLSIFGPYNILKKLSERNIVNDVGMKELFDEYEIEDVDYKGDNTYIIYTTDKEYVAVQEYYSLMNYKWFIYEKVNEWGG
ncbi:hypothetical protein [Metabacillus halosaccharovorans]|uniref:DUF3139 domain-containing protein n=1 Tax=Metabacillus halosaccharovorans TaxID=930124 RepID=A0ABT3DD45_9BACI|nr:hypothetical protein [Metabacillus halosaccharovorans]MCV9884974.1 hypothetical protein [Metabacillus halosaccharovorans]